MDQIESLKYKDHLELITEQLSKIDTTNSEKWIYDENPSSKIVDEQKTYFWIRLYISEESPNIEIGDDIAIQWTPSGEELITKFICYGKKGLERDHNDQVVNYNSEDDRGILCLMVDEKEVNYSESIPFIRTLFKTGRHYEYQLVKRNELIFLNKRNDLVIDYYDCDF
jgi:hypothetical protein